MYSTISVGSARIIWDWEIDLNKIVLNGRRCRREYSASQSEDELMILSGRIFCRIMQRRKNYWLYKTCYTFWDAIIFCHSTYAHATRLFCDVFTLNTLYSTMTKAVSILCLVKFSSPCHIYACRREKRMMACVSALLELYWVSLSSLFHR